MTEEGHEQERGTLEETRFQRGLRHGHRGTLYLSLAVAIATLVYLILLIAENSHQVRVDYVFGTAHARLIWLIIVSGLLGWLCGLATSFLIRRRTRRAR
jgi:uncharacterized integral membrane protein